MTHRRFASPMGLGLLIILGLVGCAPQHMQERSSASGASTAASGPRRLVMGIMAEPAALHRALIPPGHVVQAGDLADKVVNMGFTILDPAGVRQPMLAEAVPTLENGLWRVQPDGRMELMWKIRPGATWHDGTPLTAEDIVFTVAVAEDREIPEFRSTGTADFLESVEALDSNTVVARWRQSNFKADHLWATSIIPKHLLEGSYRERKDAFRQLAYWT